MLYDEGLAHYEIGQHLPLDNSHRQTHLARAEEIFTQLGASYELGQVKPALNQKS